MATNSRSAKLRDFLHENRDRDRDDDRDPPRRGRDDDDDRPSRTRGRDDDDDRDPPRRGRDDDRDEEPSSRRRGRDDDDDRDPPRRGRDDDDDRDSRPSNSRRNHTPREGRFTGMPSAQDRPPQLEEGNHLLRIVKTFESENPKTGTWFQIHFEVLDSTNKKHRPGSKASVRYHTERKSMTVTGPKITSFVRAACGFATDDEMRKRVPKMSESGKAGYDVLIDAALGVQKAEDQFGQNPLEGRVMLTDATKGKYDEDKDVQYYEFEWSGCDQKQEALEDGEPAPSRRRNGRDAADEDRPARSGRASRGDADDERPSRGRDSDRGSRASGRDDEPSRGRARDDEPEEREDERPRARSRR